MVWTLSQERLSQGKPQKGTPEIRVLLSESHPKGRPRGQLTSGCKFSQSKTRNRGTPLKSCCSGRHPSSTGTFGGLGAWKATGGVQTKTGFTPTLAERSLSKRGGKTHPSTFSEKSTGKMAGKKQTYFGKNGSTSEGG